MIDQVILINRHDSSMAFSEQRFGTSDLYSYNHRGFLIVNKEAGVLSLPQRFGEKPKTHYGLPHSQLDQNPPPDIYKKLKDRAFNFPFVERRPSIISVPGAEALWLLEEGGHSCVEAFMRGNEFAHVHPPDDGSMHMMLPENDVPELLEKGWGEIHPLVPVGRMPPTLVMVFGPRDAIELDVILDLIDASYRYARGIGIDS